EVALGYKDVVDPSVYVRLPIAADRGPVRAGDALLIWTTTPWTLPGNVAVAAGPDITYARVRFQGETLIIAKALIEKALGSEHTPIKGEDVLQQPSETRWEIVAEFSGDE